jgi:hypothetical protein
MDNIIGDLDFIYNGPLGARISCHMGDQGTRAYCNMVSDQPMFYIDDSAEEFEAEDDAFLADVELIETLRSRMDAYDKTAKSLTSKIIEPTQDVFDAVFSVTNDVYTITDIIDYGSQSATLASYIDHLQSLGVTFMVDATVAGASYNRAMQVIAVNPHLSLSAAIMAMAEPLRMAFHHKQGSLINPLRFQPEDAVLINRLLAADSKILSMELAWELRLAGQGGVWNSMMNGADYDLCSAYGMEAMTNFRSLKNGLAARSTFEKWFISGRCKSLDRGIIQIMLGNKVDLIFDDEDTSRMIATDMVARMGNRPMGKNYLSSIVTQVMVDGLYTEVRDRSNANFLWFITFEKRMNEVEQELQGDGTSSTTQMTNSKGSSNGSTAHIVTFPEPIGGSKGSKATGTDGASLFYLDHFRAL